MKLFQLIDFGKVVALDDKKVIPHAEFAQLVSAQELIEEIKQEQRQLQQEHEQLTEQLRISGEEKGFQAGQEQWTQHIQKLEQQIQNVHEEMMQTIVPLALTAVKKIIGKELDTNPEAIVDIVKTALKSVSQHRKVTIYVNKGDLPMLENERQQLKSVFEHLQSLAIAPRDDVTVGGCIIETEAGIINANLDRQLATLESAFREFFKGGNVKK